MWRWTVVTQAVIFAWVKVFVIFRLKWLLLMLEGTAEENDHDIRLMNLAHFKQLSFYLVLFF